MCIQVDSVTVKVRCVFDRQQPLDWINVNFASTGEVASHVFMFFSKTLVCEGERASERHQERGRNLKELKSFSSSVFSSVVWCFLW